VDWFRIANDTPLTTLLDRRRHILADLALLGAEGGGIAVEQPQQVALLVKDSLSAEALSGARPLARLIAAIATFRDQPFQPR